MNKEDSPEQQLLDMAMREEDPKLRELLMATVAMKLARDCFKETK